MRKEQADKNKFRMKRIAGGSGDDLSPPPIKQPSHRRVTTPPTRPNIPQPRFDAPDKKSVPMITLNGMVYTNDSFSICTRGFTMGFKQNDYKVSIDAWSDGNRSLPIEEEVRKAVRKGSDRKIGIRISHPNSFHVLDAYDFKIGFGVCETQTIKDNWVKICNKYCDQVWTPSTFASETFKRAGVENVYTVNNGFDPRYMNKDAKPFKYPFDDDTFVFLTVGNAQERKGSELLFHAFVDEFKNGEKVALVYKSYAPWGWGLCQYSGNNMISDELALKHNVKRFRDPRVYSIGEIGEYWDEEEQKWKLHLINNDIPYNEMGGLYTGADAFVLPTKGEGFGLPILEAKACGIPVIATNWSGHLDFCDNTDTFLLEYTNFSKAFEQHAWQGEWVEPDIQHLKYLLRHVFENREVAKRKAEIAYRRVHENFTWKDVAKVGIKYISLDYPDIWREDFIT